ncbi:MAG: anthrone oxygenase family protein [Chitinophagaceae bacterium]
MKKIILFASISLASGLLFANLYTSLIDARSWGSDIPDSIATAREYFKTVNPGNFFRFFSPVNQVLGIIVLILFWKTSPSIRICLGAALALYLLAEGLTFGYFFPRNDIMFRDAPLPDIDLLKKTWSEWNSMNWVRTVILLAGVIFSILSLHKIYSFAGERKKAAATKKHQLSNKVAVG